MADEDTLKLRSVADALQRVMADHVIDAEDIEDYWTSKAKELIEEIEVEGLILE